MNVYQKLAKARLALKQAGLRQSGENSYAGYTYFELGDFLPKIAEIECEIGLLSVVTFGTEECTLTVYNTDDGKEAECIVFKTPMETANVKGCQAIQNLGAAQTYIRRYLYNTAYEIVECDALNALQGKNDETPTKAQNTPPKAQKQNMNTKTTKAETPATTEPASSAEVKKVTTMSPARKIAELIKGTDVTGEQITDWIKSKFGEPLKVNELNKEQFEQLYTAIQTFIQGRMI